MARISVWGNSHLLSFGIRFMLTLIFISSALVFPAFAEDNAEEQEGGDDRMGAGEFISLCDQGGGDLGITAGDDGGKPAVMSCGYDDGSYVVWCADDPQNGSASGEICESHEEPARLPYDAGLSIGASGGTASAPPAKPAQPLFQIQIQASVGTFGN